MSPSMSRVGGGSGVGAVGLFYAPSIVIIERRDYFLAHFILKLIAGCPAVHGAYRVSSAVVAYGSYCPYLCSSLSSFVQRWSSTSSLKIC